MSLRTIPDSFAPDTLSAIDALLDSIERDHRVSLPLVIESGSRAWGFPSPDSDYDCRFIYIRHPDAYVSPWVPRDVIETPLVGDLDVNGWDLGKALKLMLKGNAVIIEWLMSPIIYRGDSQFREEFLALAKQHANRELIAKHYLHLGLRQRDTYFADGKPVALKKIFYALRPAAALKWMRLHPEEQVPPMDFPTLVNESLLLPEVTAIIANLLAQKAITHELGFGQIPAPIKIFIDEEFAIAKATTDAPTKRDSLAARAAVTNFYISWAKRLAV